MPNYRGYVQTLVASAVQSASGNSGAINLGSITGAAPDAASFILNVTASSAPTTLDVYLQFSTNQGTTWTDFAHYTQVGAVSTNIQLIQWARRSQALNAANTADTVTGDAVLAAGVVLNTPIIDNYFRVRWVIAGTSYTFSVIGILDRD